MNNPYREINCTPTRKERLGFGAVVLVGLGALGLIQLLLHRPRAGLGLGMAGIVVALLSQVPVLGRLLYIGWMGLGVTLGLLTSPLIMAVIYGLLFVPLGLLFRFLGRDPLKRRLDPGASTYWEDYPQADDPARYLKQY